jgi:hypothetical protein
MEDAIVPETRSPTPVTGVRTAGWLFGGFRGGLKSFENSSMRLLPPAGVANGEIAVRGAIALIRWLRAGSMSHGLTTHKVSSGRQMRPPCSSAMGTMGRWDGWDDEMMPPRILLTEGFERERTR